jgi:hypothetical protein
MARQINFLLGTVTLLLVFLASSLILVAQDGPTILKIAGKAEILEQGRKTPAKEGQRLSVGQSIQMVGGGEVQMTSSEGKIKLKVRDNTTVVYDGPVGRNSLPWRQSPSYREVGSSESSVTVPQFSVPVGRLEVDVVPGQDLRIQCPLIIASVRGTSFLVSVDLDGTSRIDTLEGRVDTFGRNGEFKLVLGGDNMQVTARQYADFLAAKGVASSGGNWRNVPARTQQSVDAEVLSGQGAAAILGISNEAAGSAGRSSRSPGSPDPMAAILGNPAASPSAGVAILASEAASGEGDPGFLVYNGNNSPVTVGFDPSQTDQGMGQSVSEAEQSGGLAGPGLGLNPESSIADLQMNVPNPGSSHSPTLPPMGYFIGTFNHPDVVNDYANILTFTLDPAAGTISNIYMDINYEFQQGASPIDLSFISGQGGSGSFDLSAKSFSGGGFSTSSWIEQWGTHTFGSYGSIATSSLDGGFGSGAINYGSSITGTLQTTFVTDGLSPNDNFIEGPDNFGFIGGFYEKPLVEVTGTFTLANVQTQNFNEYSFLLNLNNGDFYNPMAGIDYIDTASNAIIISAKQMTAGLVPGSLSGGSFSVNFPGMGVYANFNASPPYAATGATLRGNFDSATPDVGSLVTGGELEITYSVPKPAALPDRVYIQNGVAALK